MAGLRRLLESIAAQRGTPPFEVIVVDNDRHASAREIAGSFTGSLNLRYAVEPERGLSPVRNHTVKLARADCLVFVDDDEVVPPTWLAALHRGLAGSASVAAAFGPVKVVFEDGVREEIRRCRFFARPHPPEGAAIPWYFTYTANTCVKKSALPDPLAPFRPQFGKTGGEDVDLFKRIADAGGTFVAAGTDAGVKEFRERKRADLAWTLRRSLRNGGNLADLEWSGLRRRERRKLAGETFATALRCGIEAMKQRRRDRLRFVELCIDATENAGRALSVLGYRYPEYASRR